MSLGNFRSFKVYKGKNSALLGGMRCSLALSLHMIHINGFGVKKQPPIALLSNICLVVLVKTVPLLAASMWHYGICELCALQVVFPTKNYGHWIWWCPCDICDSQFWKKVFKKPISTIKSGCQGKIHCCDPSFSKSNSIWMLIYSLHSPPFSCQLEMFSQLLLKHGVLKWTKKVSYVFLKQTERNSNSENLFPGFFEDFSP